MKSAGLLLAALLLTCNLIKITLGASAEKDAPTRLLCYDGAKPPTSRTNTSKILQKIRFEMRRPTSVLGAPLDAYIIPSYDEHQSEVPNPRDRRLLQVSGFSGSEGLAVVTMKSAALWTDGRYRFQADAELSCSWLLMKQEDPNTPTLPQWLGTQLSPQARVGADPKLVPHHLWKQWSQVLKVMEIPLVAVINNLVDLAWENRPPPPKIPIYVHGKEFSGKLWLAKVEELRKELRMIGIDAMVVTALDEIAWLLNIRGKDLPYSPVAKAYLIVSHDQIHLYIDQTKLSIEAKRSLKTEGCYNSNCTKIHSYESIWSDLRTYSQAWRTVLLPSVFSFSPGVSELVYTSVPNEKSIYKPSPIINMKAKKNKKEIEGMRKAHVRDGAAMCEILSYIEERINVGDVLDELMVANVVDSNRRSQNLNKGLSFATIAGYGANSALPHYQPTNATTKRITTDSTFVLDSGGQYSDGTTDVTRTLHYGKPTPEEKKAYTLVLMASIDLSMMVFPSDLNMNDIDVMARKVLWKSQKDYMHSTGHGIGSFLQAHEAPIQIAYGQKLDAATFEPGYFFSNEPGYYEEGRFGVRLENILEVVEAFEGKPDPDGKIYLTFKDVTLVPYEPKLIDVNMLTLYQRRWLNEYYTRIRENVGAELKNSTKMHVFYWMMNKTVHVPEFGMVGEANHLGFSKYILIVFTMISYCLRNVCC